MRVFLQLFPAAAVYEGSPIRNPPHRRTESPLPAMTRPSLPVPALHPIRQHLGAFAALALLVLLTGCAGTPSRQAPGRDEPRQPPLDAQAEFFNGTVQTVAQVAGFGIPFRQPGDEPAHERESGGRPHAGGMSMGGGMGGMGHGGGGEHSGRHGSPGEQGASSPGEPRPALRGPGSMPRQTLRITFTNTGAEPVDFTVTELQSAIGNFAPQPDRLRLAPGTSATLDPVSGDAGGALEWLDVTLSLRRAGATETHILHLTRTAVATPPPQS